MLETGDALQLLLPAESFEKRLHPGFVVESDEAGFVALMEEALIPPLLPQLGTDVLAFADEAGQLYQLPMRMVDVRQTEPRPILGFARLGEPVAVERRTAFRVSTAAMELFAMVADEGECRVFDVSADGFGIVGQKQHAVGEVVRVSMKFDDILLAGPARIQTHRDLGDGMHRYGFKIVQQNVGVSRALEDIAARIQRQQLRRLSRMD